MVFCFCFLIWTPKGVLCKSPLCIASRYFHSLTPGQVGSFVVRSNILFVAWFTRTQYDGEQFPNSVWLYYVVINIRCPLSYKPSGKVARLPIQVNRNRSSMTQNELFPREKYLKKLILSILSMCTVWSVKKISPKREGFFYTTSADMICLMGLLSRWSPFPLQKPVLNGLEFCFTKYQRLNWKAALCLL